MKEKETTDMIPAQHTGKAIDAESTIELDNEQDAVAFFKIVMERLQNVNHWKEYAGSISASFQLVDQAGREIHRKAEKGDYLKIDVPGPGSLSGEGFDWVQIEAVERATGPNTESFGFRVRPTDNPRGREQNIAHFYSHESTSSFVIQRERNKITASVHDRNTKPNTDADHATDKVRDVVVGIGGALGFSKIQWKNLTDGLIRN